MTDILPFGPTRHTRQYWVNKRPEYTPPERDPHEVGAGFFKAYQTARYAQEYERVMKEDE